MLNVKTRNDFNIASITVVQTNNYWIGALPTMTSEAPSHPTSSVAQNVLHTHCPFLPLNPSNVWD